MYIYVYIYTCIYINDSVYATQTLHPTPDTSSKYQIRHQLHI